MSTVAVILAAGRGTRLQARDNNHRADLLSPDQELAASTGIKALMPIRRSGTAKRVPFLQLTLDSLAGAGIEQVCVVVRPDVRNPHQVFPKHAALELEFAIQEQPRGTADAVQTSESLVGDADLIVLNSDTFYPTRVVRALMQSNGPALVALDGHSVAADPTSNLTATLMAKWAALSIDDAGMLDQVLPPPLLAPPSPWWVNINAWRFESSIFEACRALDAANDAAAAPSGELELPRAVQWSRANLGLGYRVVCTSAPLLDLTARTDVACLERLVAS